MTLSGLVNLWPGTGCLHTNDPVESDRCQYQIFYGFDLCAKIPVQALKVYLVKMKWNLVIE